MHLVKGLNITDVRFDYDCKRLRHRGLVSLFYLSSCIFLISQ